VDGVISSDIAFEITQANKDLFIRYAAKEFNKEIINMLKKKIRVIRQGAYAKEIDKIKKDVPYGKKDTGKNIVVFPGRIGTTNYNHWKNMVDLVLEGKFDSSFMFVFTNPTKEKGKAILKEYLTSKKSWVVKENGYTKFTGLVLPSGREIYLFNFPDGRLDYIELLCMSQVGVQLFDKNEEPHGGIASREMAWCNLKLVLSDTFRINGFVDKNYKYITDMTIKDLEKKIKAIIKEDGSKIKYNVETMEEGAKILYDTIKELLNAKKKD
jgi:hypothetical protein